MERICHQYYQKLYSARAETNEGAVSQVLSYLTDSLSGHTKSLLSAPITIQELQQALADMKTGKSPGPDGIILEFYRIFWDLIEEEYLQMIRDGISKGELPFGVTQGTIALLYKGGIRQALTNWRPITLLNISYKIYAKALQLRLQPVLTDIVSSTQSAFLPRRFILDNLLLTQETIS